MAKKKQENPLEELEKSYAQWQQLYEHGGSDPFWPDGVNLDLVRNHIIYFKGQIEETCPLCMADELYLRELPPEVDMEAISCFKEKIASNWQAYREKLLALPKEVLIDRAEEIAAVKLSREVLTILSLSRNDLDYLDRFSDPLQVVAESWLSEQDGDQSAALDHALWELRDRQDAEQLYEMKQTM